MNHFISQNIPQFTFIELRIVIYLRNKNQQNEHFYSKVLI